MSFDHQDAAAQFAENLAYAGQACVLGGTACKVAVQMATAEGYPLEDGDEPRGYLLTVARSAFGATFPAMGAAVTIDGVSCRVAQSPKYTPGAALLEYFVLPANA